MPRYAQIDDNGRVVSDSVLSDASDAANLIEIPTDDPPRAGQVYDAATGTFADFVPEPEVLTRLTRVEFMDRFTDAELIALYDAADTDTGLRVTLDRWRSAESLDLTDDRVDAGLQRLVDAGLLTDTRKTEILTP